MPDADNLLNFNQTIESGSDVLNTQPYMFGVVEKDPRTGQEYLGTRAKRGPLLQRVTNTEGQTEFRPTQVSRSELKNIADQASTRWEAPGVKQAWMEANAPEAVNIKYDGIFVCFIGLPAPPYAFKILASFSFI